MSKRDDDDVKSQIISGREPNPGWFVKGKSGNPRGRPRKKKETPASGSSVRDAFLKAADRLMTLRENGREVQISERDAVKRSEVLSALKGSSHAQRNYLEPSEWTKLRRTISGGACTAMRTR